MIVHAVFLEDEELEAEGEADAGPKAEIEAHAEDLIGATLYILPTQLTCHTSCDRC